LNVKHNLIRSFGLRWLRGAIGMVCLLPALSFGAAPSTLPFTLTDPEGTPVAGVSVSLVGRTGSVLTRGDGTFHLDPEPAPPFQLIVLGEGGAVIGTVHVLTLDGPEARHLTLLPINVERVEVFSGIAPATIAPPAAAATLMSREETERLRPTRLVEALQDIPGARNAGSGQTAVPTLRGMARGRTLLLLDDGRVKTERRAGASATYLDPFSIENLEVVRGPASVAYGSDALGGIVHARTPSPNSESSSGRFELSAGTGLDYGAGGVEANIPVGSGAILAQYHQRSFSDYESPQGTVENSSARDSGGLLRGLIPAGESRLTLGLQVDRGRDIARPASDTDTARTIYPEEDSDRFTLALDLPGRGGFSSFEVAGLVGRYRLVTERSTLDLASGDRASGTSDVEANDASLRFVATRPVTEGVLRAGLDVVSRFDLNAINTQTDLPSGGQAVTTEEETIEKASGIDTGLFVEGERNLGSGKRWAVSAGLRGDAISTRNSGGFFGDHSTSDEALSGYAGLTWRRGEAFSTTLQVARGYRDPLLSDRYFYGVTGRGTITGNPDLDPETTRQIDLAVRGRAGRTQMAFFGYRYRIRDLIERFEVAPDEFAFRNRGEQEIVGLEFEIDVRISDRLSLRGFADAARGEILDDGSYPDDVPAASVGIDLLQRIDGWWWQLRSRAFARDERPGPTEQVTPGYVVFDATIGVKLSEPLELRLNLGNLADKEFLASADARAPLAPGRSVALTLAGRF
jgi:iron complex outermembrane receptor protein